MKSLLQMPWALLLVVVLSAACVPVPSPTPEPETQTIANPATENCLKQGGTHEIRLEASGEVGYCTFADGSECEEWALLRGEAAAA